MYVNDSAVEKSESEAYFWFSVAELASQDEANPGLLSYLRGVTSLLNRKPAPAPA